MIGVKLKKYRNKSSVSAYAVLIKYADDMYCLRGRGGDMSEDCVFYEMRRDILI
jgi:hypothetical protein